jgi:Putative metal-binding motif
VRAWVLAMSLAVLLAMAGAVSANAAGPYDTPPQALSVATNTTNTIPDTSSAAAEPGSCSRFYVRTVWFRFRGTGGLVKLSTLYSNFDTVMLVYAANGSQAGAQQGACSDDAPGAGLTSRIDLPTVAGQDYLVQVGGCAADASGNPCMSGGQPTAQFGKAVLTVLGNDSRGTPETLTAGVSVTRTNILASTESEPLSCQGQPYDRTVWFAFDAPRAGTATIDVGGQSTLGSSPVAPVVTIFPAGSGTPATPCGLGATIGNVGVHQQLTVSGAGRYEVQVGSRNAFDTDLMAVAYSFAPNNDVDGDRSQIPGDCDDNNASIHPGAVDVPFDNIDQDCKGGDSKDRDGDGYAAKPFGKDCNDSKRTINPGAKEIRGNWVDENCDGRRAVGLLTPTPDIAWRGSRLTAFSTIFGTLRLQNLHKRDVVLIRCTKARRCPRTVRKVAKRSSLRIGYKRALPHSAIVEVFVVRPGSNVYGAYLRYLARNGRRSPGCLAPPSGPNRKVPKRPHVVKCPR